MIQRVKGTQDFLDLSLYNWITQQIKKHLSMYNFHEIATPILEPLELFKRTLGTETDVVSKQMYEVVGDASGEEREKLCLRPEITASIVRAFVNASIQDVPWKVFSIGPAFRHERPQKGRYRQFNQCSIEVIGSESLMQDILFLAMLDALFGKVFKLSGYALVINYLGTRQDRQVYIEQLRTFLGKQEAHICEVCKRRMHTNPLRVFDCKNPECQEVYKKAPTIIESLCQESQTEWQQLRQGLEELSVSYSVRPTLVRGLDYYNKTVFEFVSVDSEGLGAQNAFCGGGRYDSLAQELGASRDYPSIGAAIGMERLQLLLDAQGHLLAYDRKPALCAVVPLSGEQQSLALHITQMLHEQNICADMVVDKSSIKAMIKAADKMGAQWAVILGSDEQATGMATIKNMTTGAEIKVAQRDIVEHLK